MAHAESTVAGRAADVAIVGSGACGALVARDLASQGLSVVVLEAGRRFDPARDLANSEANAGKIMWTEPRVFAGADGVAPKTGVGVGGGTLPFLGVMPRFRRDDFRTHSTEGVGADWPIGYDDLRSHYAKVERDFGVAGECGPCCDEPYELPMPPHRMNWHAQLLAKGARALGARPFAPPIAINSQPYDGRPACIYCGWCASGCPTGAKATSLQTYLAKAERLGSVVISEAFVNRVNYDSATGRVTGVNYIDTRGREQELAARVVVLAAHAIETPRLLFLSRNGTFPNGLANSSGKVGQGLMSHPTWQVFGTFREPVNAFKGMQMGHVMVHDDLAPDPRRGCARGFILLSYMMTPITYANLSGSFYGADLKDFLYDYARTAAWWAHAEGLPCDDNAVSLDPEVKDARGLPVARVQYAWTANDRALVAGARDRAVAMLHASGAERVRVGLQYAAHAMGPCRMGADPGTSVVNSFGQTHDIRNLFVCDTSVFVTSAGVNPTLTAMALASRSAEYLVSALNRGEL
jgi:choline dehydrogenase-like flavoprotein